MKGTLIILAIAFQKGMLHDDKDQVVPVSYVLYLMIDYLHYQSHNIPVLKQSIEHRIFSS